MTLYHLFVAFCLLLIAVLTWAAVREDRARNDLGAHFDQAVALGNAEGER